METEYVFESPDVDTIYEIPLVLKEQKFDTAMAWSVIKSFKNWKQIIESMISMSNVEKHNVFQRFQDQMLKNTLLFNAFNVIQWPSMAFNAIQWHSVTFGDVSAATR